MAGFVWFLTNHHQHGDERTGVLPNEVTEGEDEHWLFELAWAGENLRLIFPESVRFPQTLAQWKSVRHLLKVGHQRDDGDDDDPLHNQ